MFGPGDIIDPSEKFLEAKETGATLDPRTAGAGSIERSGSPAVSFTLSAFNSRD